MPEMDEGAFVLDYNMPVGTSLNQTDKVLRRVEAVLLRTPDIQGYIRRTGAELGFFATETYTGDILVSLKPAGRATADGRDFRRPPRGAQGRGSRARDGVRPARPGPDRRPGGRRTADRGQGLRPRAGELRELATEVGKVVEKVEGVVDVNTHVLLGNPDIVVRPDSVQTARVGLTEMDVESQLNAALYGQVASTVPEQDRMTKIRVRYPDRVRYDRENLASSPISLAMATPRGRCSATAGIGFVPLEPARLDPRSSGAPTSSGGRINSRSLTVTAELDKRDLGSVEPGAPDEALGAEIPARLSLGAGRELPGPARVVREPATVLVVSAALVFLLLGFQFHSLTLPILIFLAQPVSLASALFALWITGTPLNVSSFMGAILLIGLDVKNGIILIEYIGQLRAEGLPLHEALLKAGPDAVPADPDDEPLHDPRPGAAGLGLGPGCADAATARSPSSAASSRTCCSRGF